MDGAKLTETDTGPEMRGSDTLGFDTKWLPGSPHREAILKGVADGIAHVEEQGHGQPPLLVFQDGGAIPLPLVRYALTARGMQLVADRMPDAPEQTKHRDICGSIDEFKARIAENPNRAFSEKQDLVRLLQDVEHMLGRLQARRTAYETFAAELRTLGDAMDATERPDQSVGFDSIAKLIDRTNRAGNAELAENREGLFRLAETVRDVANRQEACIRQSKDCAITVGRLYRRLRGRRHWDSSEEAAS